MARYVDMNEIAKKYNLPLRGRLDFNHRLPFSYCATVDVIHRSAPQTRYTVLVTSDSRVP